MTDDVTGHEWWIGRFQADDESYCRLCGLDSDDPRADQLCERRPPALQADEGEWEQWMREQELRTLNERRTSHG